MADRPVKCGACGRDPKRMNSAVAECSHVDCPYRARASGDWGHERGWCKPDDTPFAELDGLRVLDDPEAL